MIIKTRILGDLEVSPDSILHMPQGMLGINTCKEFILLDNDASPSLKWLQSVNEPDLAFIVANPMDFFPEYDIELSDDDMDFLELDALDDVAVVTTVSFDKDSGFLTTNLMGPIIMNSRIFRAKQIVVQDDRYTTRHIINKSSSNAPIAIAVA